MINTQYRLRARPQGRPSPDDFSCVDMPVPNPQAGQAIVRILYLSLDPTNRIWMSDRDQYMEPVAIGDVMRGVGLGQVIRSNNPRFNEGDLVTGLLGWQHYCVIGEQAVPVARVPKGLGVPESTLIGVCGATGLTAYFGLLDIGQPQRGETLVVSAAAGAVGSVVGQIGRLKGCRVVGIAGGPSKCRHLTEDLSFDAAIDYRASNFEQELANATASGIDINFENAGGSIMQSVMRRMNVGSRMPLCGMISAYNDPHAMIGDFAPILMRRISIRGFVVSDFQSRFSDAIQQLADWVRSGAIKYDETILDGLEQAPAALNLLFEGANLGKLMIRVTK